MDSKAARRVVGIPANLHWFEWADDGTVPRIAASFDINDFSRVTDTIINATITIS